ncbi:MAG: ParB N-terminal domain-containing protein [Anaerolineae bacterium]|nr:ParB N-terminal domain-containing protein [Anaerolineae bacterium]
MAGQVRQTDEINAGLAQLGLAGLLPEGLSLYVADLDELREQDINPRSMPKKMFEQLVENIKDAGGLESIPLCVRVGKQIQIISGHHRVRAARAAEKKRILVLLYDELSVSRIKSKQLAHNTISGEDDPQMVKRVFEAIDELAAKFEAYVDPKIFDLIPQPVKFKPPDVDMAALSKTVLIVFLSAQMLDFRAAVDLIMPKADVDEVYLAQREIYESWREALQRVRDDMEVHSIPTAVAEMARLAVEALEARAEEKAGDD